jgi:hypothetical protein
VFFTPECFPTTPLALQTNDPAKQNGIKQFADMLAAEANIIFPAVWTLWENARNPEDRIDILRYIDVGLIGRRFRASGLLGVTRPIALNYPNNDQWGRHVPKFLENGLETPASSMADRIGKIILERFEREAPEEEIIVQRVKLPPGNLAPPSLLLPPEDHGGNSSVLEGNSLIRGEAADGIADELARRLKFVGVSNPSFGPKGEKVFTRTAPGVNSLLFLNAANAEFHNLLERPRNFDNPADMHTFANAVHLHYMGVPNKRGGDALIRLKSAVLFAIAFGVTPVIPEELDAQNYVRSQDDAIKWMLGNFNVSPNPESTENSLQTMPPKLAREILDIPPPQPIWTNSIIFSFKNGEEQVEQIDQKDLRSVEEIVDNFKSNQSGIYEENTLRAESELMRIDGLPTDTGTLELRYYAKYGTEYEEIPPDSPFLKEFPQHLSGNLAERNLLFPNEFHKNFSHQETVLPWDVYAALGVPGQEPRSTIRLTDYALAANQNAPDWANLQSQLRSIAGDVSPDEIPYLLARSPGNLDVTAKVEQSGSMALRIWPRGTSTSDIRRLLSADETQALLAEPHRFGTFVTTLPPDYESARYSIDPSLYLSVPAPQGIRREDVKDQPLPQPPHGSGKRRKQQP